MKKLLLILLTATFSFAQSKIESHQIINKEKVEGIINRIDSFPTKFIVPRTVDVWLPSNYYKDKKYSVLYTVSYTHLDVYKRQLFTKVHFRLALTLLQQQLFIEWQKHTISNYEFIV